MRLRIEAVAVLLWACAGQPRVVPPTPTKPAPVVAPAATPTPPPTPPEGLRLPKTVRPLGYAATVDLVPSADTFHGQLRIELEVSAPTDVLWLNAKRLTLDKATLGDRAGTVVGTGGELIGLSFGGPLPMGRSTVTIDYRGEVSATDWTGVFHEKEGDDWYLYTQGEAQNARAIFPCFDDPSLKTSWQVALRVPASQVALSNTPVESEQADADGTKLVTFRRTRPLPSYLIAFAAGPFEFVDAGKTGEVPLRVAVMKGRAVEATVAAAALKPSLERLEAYFGIPYPYSKLDVVAVPIFLGAMENPGLVTFTSRALLWPPEAKSVGRERGMLDILVHELAHQWFGDLVTLQWWDDTWLNESFAEWMMAKLVREWHPDWEGDVGRMEDRRNALGADSQVSARAMREPIRVQADVEHAFDGITYLKGNEVLVMLEAWLGPDVFRDGVRRYLAAHEDGNATAEDFYAAISEAAGRDVSPVFKAFVEQPGSPLVSFDLDCPKGGPAAVKLSQRRFVQLGASAPEGQLWKIPVCMRTAAGRTCTLFETPEARLELNGQCPTWLVPNDGMTGYYRSKLPPAQWGRILHGDAKQVTLVERVGIFGDLTSLLRNGDVPAKDALAQVPDAVRSGNRHLIAATTGLVSSLENRLVPPELKPKFVRWVDAMYGPPARRLGLVGKPGESDDDELLRGEVVGIAGDLGEDAALRAEATRLTKAWLADPKTLPEEAVGRVLRLAGTGRDSQLFEALYQAAKAEKKNRRRRGQLLSGMASFGGPELVKRGLEIFLSGEFDGREAFGFIFAATSSPETYDLGLHEVAAHYDEIAAKLPEDMVDVPMYLATVFCDPDHRREVEATFTPLVPKYPSTVRTLKQVLETIDTCIALKAKQQPSVAEFLRGLK